MAWEFEKPGHFGPGIIGEEAAERERLVVTKSLNVFGPGVLGDELEKLEAAVESVPDAEPTEDGEIPAEVQVPASLALTDLEAALALNPELFDQFFFSEMNRAGGPRKKALAILKSVEEKRENGPRQAVIDTLETRLLALAAT